MLAVPLGIRIAYGALSWGRFVNDVGHALRIVDRADRANLGIALDSFHMLANRSSPDALQAMDADIVFLVQLSDFLWQEVRSPEERIETARHYRVFPGEGVHTEQLAHLVRDLDRMGYRGDYSFEVFNDDYRQLPLAMVADRARKSVQVITGLAARRSLLAQRASRAV